MIADFHTHILSNIDDGSDSVETSAVMLRMMRKQGVTHCVATPHFLYYKQDINEWVDKRSAAYQKLNSYAAEQFPEIYVGAEVMFFSELAELRDDDLTRLCIQNTKTLLLELPYAQWTEFELNMVAILSIQRGYNVILAHWERYDRYQKNREFEKRLMELPVYIQVNAGSLHSLLRRKQITELFSLGHAHLLGSDCHDIYHRPPNLLEGREILERHLGTDILYQMDCLGAKLLDVQMSKETSE